MASEWTTVRAADFIEFNPRLSIKKGAMATKVAMDKLQPFTKKIPATEQASVIRNLSITLLPALHSEMWPLNRWSDHLDGSVSSKACWMSLN